MSGPKCQDCGSLMEPRNDSGDSAPASIPGWVVYLTDFWRCLGCGKERRVRE